MRLGSSGHEVLLVQERLRMAGFNPGALDGAFGPATEAAVLAFQRSEKLLADGIVGPRTAARLGFDARMQTIGGMRAFPDAERPTITVDLVAAMCPGALLNTINAHLPNVLAALAEEQLDTVPMVLVALATIRAETAGFRPISEQPSRWNTSPGGQEFDLYDKRHDLGNTGHPDGMVYRGRGFVQLTGRANYKKFGPMARVPDLEAMPEQANDSVIAARLLAVFLKSRETKIKEAILQDDLRTARRLVNGGTHGLAEFTEAYRTGQRKLGIR